MPIILIGACSAIWLRVTLKPPSERIDAISRAETEPKSWPVSDAWRCTTKLLPLSLPAILSASLLSSRLRASSCTFMPSNFPRLSLVARSALPCGSRKLRAKPSLTRTTSPIWPSRPTRSSRMTSILISPLLIGLAGWWGWRATPRGGPRAQSRGGFDDSEQRHQHHRPAEQADGAIEAAQHEAAAGEAGCQHVHDR